MTNHSLQILLVDDNAPIRQLIQLTLEEDYGYIVRTAEHGQQAIELMKDWKPDLIVLDMMMPVMDGLQFLAWRNQQYPDIPVLALTGMKREHSETQIRAAGATDVVFKPVQIPELFERIARIINRNDSVNS